MEIVLSHDQTDFDGFACAVAVQKLRPGTKIVLRRAIDRSLRYFLALHKDRFPALAWNEVDQRAVTRVTLVDFRRASRLEDFGTLLERIRERDETLEVYVYDHHAATGDDVPADVEVVDRVGAATTLLVETLRERDVALDPLEATLLALGVHTDTGSLTHAGTTARDAAAIAWLLERGANVRVIARYTRLAFTPRQRDVLSELMRSVRIDRIGAADVAFATVPLPRSVDGLGEIATEAADLLGAAATFAIFAIGGKRVQVVARGLSTSIDVGRVLETVGGGGHRSAAAASIKTLAAHEVERAIRRALEASPPELRRVRDVMSSPVRTVAPETSLAALRDSLRAWRHTGVPVVREGRLVGIVSRRDLEKAERDGRIDLPVASCMTARVLTTTPDAPLEDALATMTNADVGRLPVLAGGRIVGVVTRADVLDVLYAGVAR